MEALKANLILKRVYYPSDIINPIWFVIIRAENISAFHKPQYAGWNTINETKISVKLKRLYLERK